MESETKDTKSQLQFKKKKRKNEKERVTELEPETVQVKVQVVREKPNKISPLVGYFPSGFDPLKHSGSSSFQVYRNTKMTKRLQLVVKPDDCPAEYVGTNYSGEAAVPTGATKHVLGILDKDTQTLRLVPIAGNKIFRLEPKIKEEEALGRETSTLKELTPQEKAIKAQQTTDMWGTKKAIKKAQKKLALRQDEEPDSQKNLELKMQNVIAKCPESTESHVTLNIPPYDASATTPQKAYPLDQIIFKGEWDHLEDIYIILQQGGATANFGSYPSFIGNRIEKLKKIEINRDRRNLRGTSRWPREENNDLALCSSLFSFCCRCITTLWH